MYIEIISRSHSCNYWQHFIPIVICFLFGMVWGNFTSRSGSGQKSTAPIGADSSRLHQTLSCDTVSMTGDETPRRRSSRCISNNSEQDLWQCILSLEVLYKCTVYTFLLDNFIKIRNIHLVYCICIIHTTQCRRWIFLMIFHRPHSAVSEYLLL